MEDELLEAVSKLKIKTENDESTTEVIKEESIPIFDDAKGKHQNYFNWVNSAEFEQSGATASEIINIIEDRFYETMKNQEISLKYNSTELIGDKGSLAYTNVFINNIADAKVALSQARDFIQICTKQLLAEEDYLTGFDYVFDCLELYMDEEFAKKNPSELEKHSMSSWEDITSYENLSLKSQAAVLALKFYFYRQLRRDVNEQLEIVDEMIKLDPDFYEWHICKATILRYKRRERRYNMNESFDPTLFEVELAEIDIAKLLYPNHPQCMLDYCHLLAEIAKRLKPTWQHWKNSPLVCGTETFYSVEEVSKFLKKESEKILAVYDQSVRVNCTIADIFMKWLPRKYRNYELAKNCLEKALQLHPKSSKANHRWANYYMSTTPMDMTKAEELCSLAVKYDPRNFPACIDLVQIYLGDPGKNKDKLNDIFDMHLKQSHIPLSKRNEADLLFYKGLFLHLKSGFELEAIDNLIKAQDMLGDLQFDRLCFNQERYKWPNGHLTISKIQEAVKYAMADPEYNKNEKTTALEVMMNSLKNTEQREKDRLENETSGSRGGFHGRNRGTRGSRNGNWSRRRYYDTPHTSRRGW